MDFITCGSFVYFFMFIVHCCLHQDVHNKKLLQGWLQSIQQSLEPWDKTNTQNTQRNTQRNAEITRTCSQIFHLWIPWSADPGELCSKEEQICHSSQLYASLQNNSRRRWEQARYHPDNLDHRISTYSCKRSTRRWSLCMFMNMPDVAAVAAYVCDLPVWNQGKSIRRQKTLSELAISLVLPEQEKLLEYWNITCHSL